MSESSLPPVAGWKDWGPIFTDAGLWWPVVERLWASDPALEAATRISTPIHVEAGFPGTCAVFVVDGVVVIKFFPPMVARDYDRERIAYGRIGALSPALPRLLAEGVFIDRIPWPYLVFSRVPGRAWREARAYMSRAAQLSITGELGRIVRLVHDTPLPADGSWPALSAWRELVEARLPQIAGELSTNTALPQGIIREVEAAALATDWFVERPRLLNADLTEDHLLVSRRVGRWALSGLIDWADAEVGDAYYEWVGPWFSICRRDAGLFRGFLAGYDPALRLEDISADRFLTFTALHRFGAAIIGDALLLAEQSAIGSRAELIAALFPGLPG
jgi:hygromycin-B 7''-O-kinase